MKKITKPHENIHNIYDGEQGSSDGSGIKSSCSYRGPRFSSHHPHGDSQQSESVTPVTEDQCSLQASNGTACSINTQKIKKSEIFS